MQRLLHWIKSWSHQQWVLLIGMIIAFDTLLTACGPKKIDDVRTETRYDIIIYEYDGSVREKFENVEEFYCTEGGVTKFKNDGKFYYYSNMPIKTVKKEVAVHD